MNIKVMRKGGFLCAVGTFSCLCGFSPGTPPSFPDMETGTDKLTLCVNLNVNGRLFLYVSPAVG